MQAIDPTRKDSRRALGDFAHDAREYAPLAFARSCHGLARPLVEMSSRRGTAEGRPPIAFLSVLVETRIAGGLTKSAAELSPSP